MDQGLITRWPGKSPDAEGISHAAVLHMLDVAAVAEILAPPLLPHPLRQAFLLLAALHDLGKVNLAFRAMLQTGTPQTAGRHWEVTEALLRAHDARLAGVLGASWQVRHELYAASAGHHGRPPGKELQDRRGQPWGQWQAMLAAAGPEAAQDAAAVIDAFLTLWPGASVEGRAHTDAMALSWQLAGLITAADWIGSNPAWFPPCPAAPDPAAYLRSARLRAQAAVQAAGISAPAVRDTSLFDIQLWPMQAACLQIPLPDGPALAILEDETGAGKTEAALILAQRMLREGKAQGLFFALPTMATADAMFARVAAALTRLFAGAPSLVLAHGRASLHQGFRDMKDARALNPDDPGPTEWLADGRRRALMATVGVGTVDQALLAVVRAKHAPLRQFGLASKILIVDEAHEMGDPYMGALLEGLLQMHAAQGGSAILMSATLDLSLRARLVTAFQAGAGRPVAADPGPAYPALTVSEATCPPIPARLSPRGQVAVRRLETLDQALDVVTAGVKQGAACLLIRNAVDEAVAAFRALQDQGIPSDLLHARFTLHDRKRHETQALATFGKERSARPGRVLVATQVVESSLDLDFDVMVSDLAPMAALVQRAGRLWRHMDLRPAAARPLDGPLLYVLSPDPDRVDGGAWAKAVLGQGAYVYPAPLLWRTARALFDVGVIDAPSDLRRLIEAAHSGEVAVPSALETADLTAIGQAGAQRNHAHSNRIGWAEGYRRGASGAGDADYPTRLGQPQTALVLMRNGAPWSGGEWKVDSCQLSEVQASLSRLNRLPLPESAPPPGLPDWLTATRHFVPVGDGGVICEGLRYVAEIGLLFD